MGAIIMLLAALAAADWFYTGIVRNADHVDVSYGRGSPSQRLDIYLPHGPGPFPSECSRMVALSRSATSTPLSAASATMWRP